MKKKSITEWTKKQKEMILDALLLNKSTKDSELIKFGIVDKQGRITLKGESIGRHIAAEKHPEWNL